MGNIPSNNESRGCDKFCSKEINILQNAIGYSE